MADIQAQRNNIGRAGTHLEAARVKALRIQDQDIPNLAQAYSRDVRGVLDREILRTGNRIVDGVVDVVANRSFAARAVRTSLGGAGFLANLVLDNGTVNGLRSDALRSRIGWNFNRHIQRIHRHAYYTTETANAMVHTDRRITQYLRNGTDIGSFQAAPFQPLTPPQSTISRLVTGGVAVLNHPIVRRMIGAVLAANPALAAGAMVIGRAVQGCGISRSAIIVGLKFVPKVGPILSVVASAGFALHDNHQDGKRGWQLIGATAVDTGINLAFSLGIGKLVGRVVPVPSGTGSRVTESISREIAKHATSEQLSDLRSGVNDLIWGSSASGSAPAVGRAVANNTARWASSALLRGT